MLKLTVAALTAGAAMWPLACGAQHSTGQEREKVEVSPGTSQPADSIDRQKVAKRIVEQTNEFRKSQGLEAVSQNEHLTEAATYFAEYMAKTDEYGHGADGKSPSERAKEYGYDYCIVSENIAYQYSSIGFEGPQLAERFVEGWKESPGHRRNMLEPAVTETGVAVARSDSTGHWYAVQMFGRPKSASIRFQIANRSSAEIEYRMADRTFSLPPRYTRTHEVCRDPKLTLALPSGEKTIEPTSGDSYIVNGSGESVSVKKQAVN